MLDERRLSRVEHGGPAEDAGPQIGYGDALFFQLRRQGEQGWPGILALIDDFTRRCLAQQDVGEASFLVFLRVQDDADAGSEGRSHGVRGGRGPPLGDTDVDEIAFEEGVQVRSLLNFSGERDRTEKSCRGLALSIDRRKKSSKKTAPSKSGGAAGVRNVPHLKKVPHRRITVEDTDIVVLGTAHVSAQSVEDVRLVYDQHKPDVVAVELCASRYEALTDPDRWKNLDLGRVVREKKIWLLASSLILSSFQKKIGQMTGVRPGEEMLVGANLATENDRTLVLADREVRITLARAWSRVGFFSRLWLISNLAASLLVSEEVEPEEIENLKNQDVFEEMISHLPKRYASLKQVILDERDQYLAEKIRRAARDLHEQRTRRTARSKSASKKKAASAASKPRLMAVVGAGHLNGIGRVLDSATRVDLDELDEPPAPRRFKDIGSWVLFGLVLFAASALVFRRPDILGELLIAWVVCRSAGALFGTLIAGAHPLTMLVTAAAAPVSYFFGFIGVRLWMVSALIELRFKKPRVEDFESIARDTETFAGFRRSLYRNRVLHLFFIIIAVSLGLNAGLAVFWGIVWWLATGDPAAAALSF